MKAFIVDRYTSKDSGRIGGMSEPGLQDDDVLVQIHAAGVNSLDSKIRDGEFKLILPYPLRLILGNELAGIGAYSNFYYVLDPEKLTMEKKKPEWGNVGKSAPVNTLTVFWFNNSILKNHSAENYFFGKHVNSYLAKVSYE